MSARDNILNKLRQALPAGDDRGTAPQVQDYYAQVPANSTRPERVAQLRTLLEAAHADVIVAKSGNWAQLTADQLLAMGVRTLALNEDDRDSRALAAALQGRVALTGFNRPIEAWKQELFDTVDAGFTVANSAIAATGTLVFKSAPELPRSLSLVPPLHVALVKAETIHAHLFAAALDEQWAAAMPTNLVMVSGPSKTSDIQQTLAYGAHGPKQMLVVIVEGDAP
jgi:L-lactate dehydrogenase complex protein LldG